MYYISTCLWVR